METTKTSTNNITTTSCTTLPSRKNQYNVVLRRGLGPLHLALSAYNTCTERCTPRSGERKQAARRTSDCDAFRTSNEDYTPGRIRVGSDLCCGYIWFFVKLRSKRCSACLLCFPPVGTPLPQCSSEVHSEPEWTSCVSQDAPPCNDDRIFGRRHAGCSKPIPLSGLKHSVCMSHTPVMGSCFKIYCERCRIPGATTLSGSCSASMTWTRAGPLTLRSSERRCATWELTI